MKPIVSIVSIALVAALSTGCVAKKKHDALSQELSRTRTQMQSEIDACGARIATLEGELAAEKARGEEAKRALEELARRKAESDKRVAEFRGLLDRFKGLIDAGKLQVKIVDGRMVVVMKTDVLFSSGSATLSADGKSAIIEVAQVLASIEGRKFQVEGHTDDVPIKTAVYPSNWELASARALRVVKTMIDAGLPADRISGASFAEAKPSRGNDTVEGRAMNRRIEIVVLPDLSSLPGFDELQQISRVN